VKFVLAQNKKIINPPATALKTPELIMEKIKWSSHKGQFRSWCFCKSGCCVDSECWSRMRHI
jgi:hypothetical protein